MSLELKNKLSKPLSPIVIVFIIIVANILVFTAFINFMNGPSKKLIAEAKTEAGFLLRVPEVTGLKKVDESGMAETIDSKHGCYAYTFQGGSDFQDTKGKMDMIIAESDFKPSNYNSITNKNTIDEYNTYFMSGNGSTLNLQISNTSNVSIVKKDQSQVGASSIVVRTEVCTRYQ